MSEPAEPAKRDVCLTLLGARPSVFVHLDPRREGVAVPAGFAGQSHLVLQIGMSMPVPIPDLAVDDDGIVATLSFSRTPFTCRLPWSAIFGLFGDDQRGYLWRKDMPTDVTMNREPPAKSSRPPLRIVSTDESASPPAPARAQEAPTPVVPVRAGKPRVMPRIAPAKLVPSAPSSTPPDRPTPKPPRPTHLRRVK